MLAKMIWLSKLFQVWSMMKFIRRFPNAVFFKAPYERSNKQLFFENAMFLLTFYQLQLGKKIILKQIVPSIDKIYE